MASDYELYIRTDELLSLQKAESDLVTHDELLFQLTHQSSEIWMKAVLHDLHEAIRQMQTSDDLRRATHLLLRSARIISFLSEQILILEMMHPADYHTVRLALGRGSGQDSPGFNRILNMARPMEEAYQSVLQKRGAAPLEILGSPYQHGELHDFLQALLELDEQFGRFRQNHLNLVRREIGLDVLSLKGVPAQKLQAGTRAVMFKELWDALSELTNSLNAQY